MTKTGTQIHKQTIHSKSDFRIRIQATSKHGVGVGVGDKADCLKKGTRPIGGMLSVWVFLWDPSPYLREFRRKPRKTPNG